MKRIIWTSRLNINDWKDDFEEWKAEIGCENADIWEWASDENFYNLEAARVNLNILLDNDIVAIADLGLWDWRSMGYKIIGRNIKDCLYSKVDDAEWYVDAYDFKGEMAHHDGTNYVTYRVFKDITEKQKEIFLDKLYMGNVTKREISKYTKSLRPYIAEVFGW